MTVRDNGSKNGISVNGIRMEEAELKEGDIVQVGDFIFRFNYAASAGQEQAVQLESGPALGNADGAQQDIAAAYSTGKSVKSRRSSGPRTLILAIVFFGAVGYLYMNMNASKPDDDAKHKKRPLTAPIRRRRRPILSRRALFRILCIRWIRRAQWPRRTLP